jgi:hypothetical protein
MTAWCHLPTIFNRRYALQLAGLLALCTALMTALLFANVSHALPSTDRTVSFQGRLTTSTGAVVPDGSYNIQFKIYQDGTGTAAGNPGGSLKWTETYINNGGTSGVAVKDGFFSVDLGSVTPFGTNIDWNQGTLWLSMNVAGASTSCTSFGASPCVDDGEMLPMKRITAAPYAINSGQLEGKTADNFVQLAQGVQTDASSNTSSIFINKTSTGNLIQLQSAATDVFTVGNAGDLTLGNNADKTISIAAAADTVGGNNLAVRAGGGGNGSGSAGGDLALQGGAAGGTNGNGGNLQIDAGAGTGSGSDGSIAIGSTRASSITIGSTTQSTSQDITVGGNNTAGSSSNVTIGAGGSASSGSTTVQAKNAVTIETNGTTRATFSDNSNTVYFGNGVSSATPSNATIQGTNSSATAIAGGSLTVQGGNATTGDANGGNITLSGGSGSGSGANGLVVMTTPTFSTVTDDANCYASGAAVSSSCTIAASTVNNSSAVLVGFSTSGQAATLPNPSLTTAGRIIYVMAGGDSQDFTLRANVGGGTNVEQNIAMRKNTTTTMIWNGSDWTAAGGGSTTLQNAYDNTPQSTGGNEIILNNDIGGLTIHDSTIDPVSSTLLGVKNAADASLFSVNNNVTGGTENATDGIVHDATNFSTNWPAVGSSVVTRNTSDGQEGNNSAQIAAGTTAGNGIKNKLSVSPPVNSYYRASVYAKLVSGDAFTDFKVRYSPDGGSSFVDCTNYNTQTITTTGWTQITCDVNTGATVVTDPYVYLVQPTAPTNPRTYLVDTFSFTLASNATPNVKIGSGSNSGSPTLFTLDKSATAPTASDNNSLLGSMYYDTTLGKVQCYEASGWSSCGDSPDTFVTISPEYTNAVMNGTDIGTITSDLCSDALNINNGTSSQPSICGTNETYNFYKWTSSETTDQTRSIFVTYQLPPTFKAFVAGSVSLMGRTDSTDSGVTYQVYHDTGTGLTSCGSAVSVSTGTQSTWQKAATDPSTCGFKAGDSILFRINLTAKNNANAYVSNLGFTFNN